MDTLDLSIKTQTVTQPAQKDIQLDIVSNHSEQSTCTATTYEPNSEDTTNNDCDDEDQCYDHYETAVESFDTFTSTKITKTSRMLRYAPRFQEKKIQKKIQEKKILKKKSKKKFQIFF
jgi:hypothetical protein